MSNELRRGRRYLRHVGALVASTPVATGVGIGFLVLLVAAFLVPHSLDWLSRLQSVASVLSLVLLFALHHSQHRDQIAMQRKLDELLQAHEHTDNKLIGLETAPDETLDEIDERHAGLLDR